MFGMRPYLLACSLGFAHHCLVMIYLLIVVLDNLSTSLGQCFLCEISIDQCVDPALGSAISGEFTSCSRKACRIVQPRPCPQQGRSADGQSYVVLCGNHACNDDRCCRTTTPFCVIMLSPSAPVCTHMPAVSAQPHHTPTADVHKRNPWLARKPLLQQVGPQVLFPCCFCHRHCSASPCCRDQRRVVEM